MVCREMRTLLRHREDSRECCRHPLFFRVRKCLRNAYLAGPFSLHDLQRLL